MFVTNLLIIGAMTYSGAKTYLKHRHNQTVVVVQTAPPLTAEEVLAERQHSANLSAVSLGLALAGSLFYPPLTPLSAPLNVYTTLPLFNRAFETLWGKEDSPESLIGSLFMVTSLATNHYLLASFVDWVGSRLRLTQSRLRLTQNQFADETLDKVAQFARQAVGQKPEMVWVQREHGEYQISYEQLDVGDIVVVERGQFVAVDGVVEEGTAVILDLLTPVPATGPIEKWVGDVVTARMFVLSGILYVRIESL